MPDWEVTVVTESNYLKKVTVTNCFNRQDAETEAISSTGARKVVISNPIHYTANTQEDTNNNSEVLEVHHYYEKEDDDNDDYYNQLDEAEIEMYDLMCQIAMSKGEELPTISEFYDWLESN